MPDSEPKPVPTEAPKTLAQKILEIQDAVGVVNKKGQFGSEMGGGKYLRIEDAVVAVNKLLVKHRLTLTGDLLRRQDGEFFMTRTPHEKGSKDGPVRSGYIVDVIMDWTIVDNDTGQIGHWFIPGGGYDGTDKAVYKAQTGSRKYALINIFNLPIGNDVEEHGTVTFEEGKEKQRKIAANKIAEAASRGVPSAIDAMSQVEPEKKVFILRPEEYNGHHIIVSGYTAIPPMQNFFEDTGCKFVKSRQTGKMAWKVPQEYEKGLLGLCEKLNLEVE